MRQKKHIFLKRITPVFVITFLFCLPLVVLISQPFLTYAQDRGGDDSWRLYTKADGLPFDKISRIFQDKDGDLWIVSAFGYEITSTITSTLTLTSAGQLGEFAQFTTGSGIARFDGLHWITYTTKSTHGKLPSDNIMAVLADQAGKVWFSLFSNEGRGLGVVSFDGEQWQAFTQEDGLADNTVYAMLQAKDGAFWFATNGGVTRYDGKSQWETFKSEDTLGGSIALDIFQASDGALWFSVIKKGGCLTRYYLNTWKPCLIAGDLPFDDISQLTQDKAGHWWIRSFAGISVASDQPILTAPEANVNFTVVSDSSIASYDGEVWRMIDSRNSDLPDDFVNRLYRDNVGNLWFATKNGAARYDGESWQVYTETLQSPILDLLNDNVDQTIWLATASGLQSSQEDRWRIFTPEDGLVGNNVQQLTEGGDDTIWVIVSPTSLLSRYQNGTWRTFAAKDGLASSDVLQFFETEDRTLWVATARGLSQYRDGVWRTFPIDYHWRVVRQIFETQDGALWVGTDSGLSRYYDGEWRTFGIKDGLVSDDIWRFIKTRDGALWVGTGNGLNRYQNEKWQAFTTNDGIASDIIWCLAETGDGALWVGTDKGLSRYKDGAWRTYTTENGLASHQIWRLLETRDGALWVGTDSGLNRYEDGVWHIFTTEDGLVSNQIWRLLETSDGALWVGTNMGLSRYKDGAWQTYTTENGLVDNRIRRLVETKDSTVWVGTDKGLSRYQDGEWQIPTVTDNLHGLLNGQISYLLPTQDGALWVISEVSLLQRYRNGIWQGVTTQDGVVSNSVSQLFKASDGAVWVGTSEGLSRYYKGQWQTFTTKEGLVSNHIWQLLETSDGAVWVGTDLGLSRYQNGQWQAFTAEAGDLASNAVDKIAETNDGAVWVSYTYDYEKERSLGLSRYYGGQWQTFAAQNGLPSDNVREIIGVRDGALWVVTDSGLSRYQDGVWQTFTAEAGNLSSNNVEEIVETEDGAVWVSYGYDYENKRSFGLSRYQEDQWQAFTTETGNFSDGYISQFLETDDGALWVRGWYGGVSRYQAGRWQNFTVESGNLPSSNVSQLLKADDGSVWVITPKGISRHKEGTWQTFNAELDLTSSDVPPAFSTGGGVIWINTKQGFVRYRSTGRPPQIKILTINDHSPMDNAVTLNYDDRRPVIKFDGGDLLTPSDKLRYFYRLDSLNDSWQRADSNTIFYPPLSPGRYTFWLKAIDEDGNVSKPAEVKIIVPSPEIPPYVYGLAGLTMLVVTTTVGFNRWRVQRRTRQAITRKDNPYIANVPVKDPKMFFGREEILSQIINGIDHNNFAICGPKRIGKTSLLHRLADTLDRLDDSPYSFWPVMLSLHGVPEDHFFQTLGQAIARKCRAEVGSPSSLGLDAGKVYDAYAFLSDLDTVQNALQEASDKPLRLVLLVDEGDALNEYSQPTLAQLRYVLMGPALEFLKMVWTGEKLDQRPWALPGSDWLTVFGHVFYLTPLDEEEAINLIQKPVPYYRYDKEAIRLILDKSQLVPHRIQLLCRAVVEEMLKEGRGRIKVKDVEAAIHSLSGGTTQAGSLYPTALTSADVIEQQARRLAEPRVEYHTDADHEEVE